MKYLICIFCAALIFSSAWSQNGVDFKLETEIPVQVDGISSVVGFNGIANLYAPESEAAYVTIRGSLSLDGFNANLKSILEKAISEHDKCGKRLHVTHANIEKTERGLAFVRVNLNYQEWTCVGSIKTRLFSQSGSLLLAVKPMAIGRKIDFQTRVEEISASGALGSLIRNSSDIKSEIKGLIEDQLPQSMMAGVPKEIRNLESFEVEQVAFQNGPKLDVTVKAKSDMDTLMSYLLKFKK